MPKIKNWTRHDDQVDAKDAPAGWFHDKKKQMLYIQKYEMRNHSGNYYAVKIMSTANGHDYMDTLREVDTKMDAMEVARGYARRNPDGIETLGGIEPSEFDSR